MGGKKIILKSDDNSAESYVFAISTSLNELQLSLKINLALELNLQLTEPLKALLSKTEVNFSRANTPFSEDYYVQLVKLKSGSQLLFKELVAFDYVLVLSGSEAAVKKDEVLSTLKEIKNISLLKLYAPSNLRTFNKYFQ